MAGSQIGSLILLFVLHLKGSLKSFIAATISCIKQAVMMGTEVGSLSLHLKPLHFWSKRLLDKGYLEYGCTHYRRRCRIRAPCCNEIFDCRLCHNELKNNHDLGHSIPRRQIRQVICSLCNTEQEVQQVCINCGVCMGRYFCKTCKLFDDDTSKKQFHCLDCGICRVGGQDNFFHCNKCQCCLSNSVKGTHSCIEGLIHRNCAVCCEYMFESRTKLAKLPCDHVIHFDCVFEMASFRTCPVCSKTCADMTKIWEENNMKIAATPMPPHIQIKLIRIHCNDCNSKSVVQHHFVGNKCPNCKSYNTHKQGRSQKFKLVGSKFENFR